MSEENSLEKITDTIQDLATGIPAPVRKNFWKAVGQLCTAAVNVPVSWLEGKANEIKTTFEARSEIIKKQGDKISQQIDVPKAYIDKASEKFASKIIKEQINLDQIVANAAQTLSLPENTNKNQSEPVEEISDDWLNEFENYARLKSSEDMRTIFGKILSGEVNKPGSFSIKTVRLISQLDNEAARLFQILCSNSVSYNIGERLHDVRVVSLSGSAGNNSLTPFGLSFDNLNILQEYGLIISDYNSYMPYSACIVNEHNEVYATLGFGGKRYCLKPTDREKYPKELKFHGVALTKAAKELFSIIPKSDYRNYQLQFIAFLNQNYLSLEEIPS